MHVLDPKELQKRSHASRKQKRRTARVVVFLLTLIFVSLGVLGWSVLRRVQPGSGSSVVPASKTKKAATQPAAGKSKTTLKTFSGTQFRDLYRSIHYPNTEPFTTPPEITGNLAADAHIRELASKRGFVLTSIPVEPIQKTKEPMLAGETDDLLQPLALKSWQQLKQAAAKDGIKLTLISAYRSPQWQRDLFMQRLLAHGVSVEQVAAGSADTAVNDTLGMTAVPGYSRHHTGYTVDLYCQDGIATFADSSCDTWISKNNFANAKKYGWIPSYPPGAGEQGPEPEPWEYVWVGTDVLYQ